MTTVFSFVFLLATFATGILYFAAKKSGQPTRNLLIAFCGTGLLTLILAFQDPHKVVAVLSIIGAAFGLLGAAVWALIKRVNGKKMGKPLRIVMAACVALVLVFTPACADLNTPPDTGQHQPGDNPGENNPNEPPDQQPITTPQPPAKPISLATKDAGETQLTVTWASVEDAEKYLVFISTSENGTFDLATETTSTSATIIDLKENTTYWFRVIAVNDDGESDHAAISGKTKQKPSTGTVAGKTIVHFINVGQGDSILIQAPGKIVLIDGGSKSQGSTVVNYLKKLGITTIDYVIATHPHEDHIGGLIDVLKNFTVREVIDTGVPHTTKTFEEYLTLIDQKDINFTEGRAGQKYDLGGGSELRILHPTSPSANNLNNASVVTRLTFGSTSFLFAGDAESASETEILSRGGTLASTVLKVGHHGSSTSTTQNFLNAIKPAMAVIMVGSNSYGHPTDQTLKRLHEAKIQIFRTDKNGTIVMTSDGSKVTADKSPWTYTASGGTGGTGGTGGGLKYVGSRTSEVFHLSSCHHVDRIAQANFVEYKSRQEAINLGKRPCKTCNP